MPAPDARRAHVAVIAPHLRDQNEFQFLHRPPTGGSGRMNVRSHRAVVSDREGETFRGCSLETT